MTIGDLVNVHWGNSDWSGEEGVEWGYAPGIVTGEIVWWADSNPQRLSHQERVYPCGDIEILFRGERTMFNLGRCEVINESR